MKAHIPSVGFQCPLCGAVFFLKARFDDHRDAEIPIFRAQSLLKNALAEGRWRERQREIGRIREDGTWADDWRPGITEAPQPPLVLDGGEGDAP